MGVILKLAAIDIGTNAVRLLFYNIYNDLEGKTVFKKVALTRVPIRLGEDVFTSNKISKEKEESLKKTMQAFKNLIDVHQVDQYKACATSAMREAENGALIIKDIKEKIGVEIQIISGDTEADLLFNNQISNSQGKHDAFLYIDVGGGSTELNLFHKGENLFSKSFNLGTVRMLCDKVESSTWKELKEACESIRKKYKSIGGIGSGGNIIKIQDISKQKKGQLSRAKLKDVHRMLSSFTFEERIRGFEMNPDRADVIIPACQIFMFIMQHAGIQTIYVPKAGLSDGIIRSMYEEISQNK